MCSSQSIIVAYTDPTKAKMRKKIENTSRRNDPISLVDGQNAAAPTTLR